MIRVLLIEDSELDAELILRKINSMEEDTEVRVVQLFEEFKEAIESFNPDLILSDFNLRSFQGDDALSYTRTHYQDLPFVSVSGSITKEIEVTLLENKVSDLLSKDNLQRLPYVIRRVLSEKKDRMKLRQTLRDKEILLAEVHHRVKNNLAVISSFLQLDLFSLDDEYSESSSEEKLQKNISRIQSIASIHELVYQNNDLSNIPVKEIISEILHTSTKSQSSLGDSEFRMHGSNDVSINMNQAVSLALLMNELFNDCNNYLKEKKQPIDGLFDIKLSAEEDQIQIEFTTGDFESYIVEELYSEGKMRNQIIGLLMTQLDARFEKSSDDGAYCLCFKKKEVKGSASSMVGSKASILSA